MAKEVWLLSDGSTLQVLRMEDGFFDVVNNAFYPKQTFLQHISAMGGHLITSEAMNRILEGERTFSFNE